MTGILLIHGAWHGPWCWEEFAKRLTERGHEVRAVRLRGHDRPGRIWYRVHHYVEDVRRAVAEFSTPPVLVGHSLGGLVAQKYLERNPAAAGVVLLASVPTGGTIGVAARLAVRHPIQFLKANLLLRLRPLVATPKLARELFFTPDTPQEIVDRCFARLQDESYPTFIDTMVVLARPRRVEVRVLVLGAERDAIITIDEVQRTARAYRTEAEIFPHLGHNMMLDEGWPKVADRIDAWVRQLPRGDRGEKSVSAAHENVTLGS